MARSEYHDGAGFCRQQSNNRVLNNGIHITCLAVMSACLVSPCLTVSARDESCVMRSGEWEFFAERLLLCLIAHSVSSSIELTTALPAACVKNAKFKH